MLSGPTLDTEEDILVKQHKHLMKSETVLSAALAEFRALILPSVIPTETSARQM